MGRTPAEELNPASPSLPVPLAVILSVNVSLNDTQGGASCWQSHSLGSYGRANPTNPVTGDPENVLSTEILVPGMRLHTTPSDQPAML